MSTLEQFLARWSRRKSEAAADARENDTEPAQHTKPDAATSEAAPDNAVDLRSADERAPPTAASASSELITPAFDPATLPPLDSITAETDIRPFLAPGVPAEFTREALRRAWSVDPTVRDFIGLADYAWDYHAASVPGFGPLEATDDIKRMVARIMGDGDAEQQAPPETTPETATIAANTDAPASPLESEPQSLLADAIKDGRAVVADSQSVHGCDESPQDNNASAAPQDENQETADLRPIVRRTHGGALPKC